MRHALATVAIVFMTLSGLAPGHAEKRAGSGFLNRAISGISA
jgi:hypothetical protein